MLFCPFLHYSPNHNASILPMAISTVFRRQTAVSTARTTRPPSAVASTASNRRCWLAVCSATVCQTSTTLRCVATTTRHWRQPSARRWSIGAAASQSIAELHSAPATPEQRRSIHAPNAADDDRQREWHPNVSILRNSSKKNGKDRSPTFVKHEPIKTKRNPIQRINLIAIVL